MNALVVADGFVGGEGSQWAIILATVLGTAALVASIGVLLGRREASVQRRLAGYEMPEVGDVVTSGGPGEPETAIMQQGVELASRLAGRTSLFDRTEKMLTQADIPIRPGELIFYTALGSVLIFLFASILIGWVAGLIAAAVLVAGVVVYFSGKRTRRLNEFERMLPPTLTLLASSMRAGFSMMQSLETVTQEAPPVVRREFQRVFTEVRLGRPVEEALEDIAERMNSRDLAWTVMAIRIQREVGGNLAVLLDTIADTMNKREQLRREVRTLTAEGRLSGVVLSLFPLGMLAVLYILRPDYVQILFDEPLGIAALIAAGISTVIGWLIIRKIVDIEA
jgi:tight adherence protein B